MEEVLCFSGKELIHMAKECKPQGIKFFAAEMFSDKITVSRIAFFLAFAQKVIEENPLSKQKIYEDVLESIYNGIKF